MKASSILLILLRTEFEQVRQALEARNKERKNDGKGNKANAVEPMIRSDEGLTLETSALPFYLTVV